MTRPSAGIVLYRRGSVGLEIFLVHPGGPFWSRKDDGAWSIPKGEYAAQEDALSAARREFAEETGSAVNGPFLPLTPCRQSGGKLVTAWAVEGDLDPGQIRSNEFSLEWPPRSGRLQSFPEIDRAAWFALPLARSKILKGQIPLLEELFARISTPFDTGGGGEA
jgi:predicted NUDIX family NTP pyrophosphohydrolase